MTYCECCSTEFEYVASTCFYHATSCCQYLCDECTRNWIESYRTSRWKNISCYKCLEPVTSSDYLKFLNEDQKIEHEIGQLLLLELEEGEKWLICSYCGYQEIGEEDDVFLMCKNENCVKLTCVICHKTINYSSENKIEFKRLSLDNTALKWMIEGLEGEIENHKVCCENTSLIGKIEKALEDSYSRKCPSCLFRGRKDENCTHITCENCGFYWCYICGQNLNEISDHNYPLEDLHEQCPMYMYDVVNIRSSWPYDPDEALDKFHKHLAIYRLKTLFDSLGCNKQSSFEIVHEKFPTVFLGITLGEIKSFSEYIFREVEAA